MTSQPSTLEYLSAAVDVGLLNPDMNSSVSSAQSSTIGDLSFLNTSGFANSLAALPESLSALPGFPDRFIGVTSPASELKDGFFAAVYETPQNQYIVAFQYSEFGNDAQPIAGNPYSAATVSNSAAFADNQFPSQLASDISGFMNSVELLAAINGVSNQNIFVTGVSQGSVEAEYAMNQGAAPGFGQLGGGAAFESTGLPQYSAATDPNSAYEDANFTNYLTYGDPVSSWSSDASDPGASPVALATSAGLVLGLHNQDHVGRIVGVGDPSLQTGLDLSYFLDDIGFRSGVVNSQNAPPPEALQNLETMFSPSADPWSVLHADGVAGLLVDAVGQELGVDQLGQDIAQLTDQLIAEVSGVPMS
jgi:hypothetical protein